MKQSLQIVTQSTIKLIIDNAKYIAVDKSGHPMVKETIEKLVDLAVTVGKHSV